MLLEILILRISYKGCLSTEMKLNKQIFTVSTQTLLTNSPSITEIFKARLNLGCVISCNLQII